MNRSAARSSVAATVGLLAVGLTVGLRNRSETQQTELSKNETAAHPRRVYPYSVIPGGVQTGEELRRALQGDSVAREHYRGFNLDRVRHEVVREARDVFVSYRIADRIFWTGKRVRLRKGEVILTDGVSQARARCGNRIADEPRTELSTAEPDEAALNAWLEKPTVEQTSAEQEWSAPASDSWPSNGAGEKGDLLSKFGPAVVFGNADDADPSGVGRVFGRTGFGRVRSGVESAAADEKSKANSPVGSIAPLKIQPPAAGEVLLAAPGILPSWTPWKNWFIFEGSALNPSAYGNDAGPVLALQVVRQNSTSGAQSVKFSDTPVQFSGEWESIFDSAANAAEIDQAVSSVSAPRQAPIQDVQVPEPGTATHGFLAGTLLLGALLIRRYSAFRLRGLAQKE